MSGRDIGIVALVVLGVLVLLPLLGGAGMMGGMMGPGTMGPGMMGAPWGGRWGHGWLPFAGGLFWILIIVGVALVVSSLTRRGAAGSVPGAPETPLDILKTRLARGEITLEEYEKLKKEVV
jgi:putative membrane protein